VPAISRGVTVSTAVTGGKVRSPMAKVTVSPSTNSNSPCALVTPLWVAVSKSTLATGASRKTPVVLVGCGIGAKHQACHYRYYKRLKKELLLLVMKL